MNDPTHTPKAYTWTSPSAIPGFYYIHTYKEGDRNATMRLVDENGNPPQFFSITGDGQPPVTGILAFADPDNNEIPQP